jgi:hypothetical protein
MTKDKFTGTLKLIAGFSDGEIEQTFVMKDFFKINSLFDPINRKQK